MRHLELKPEDDFPELEPLLAEMNEERCIDCHRIVIWSERTIEGIWAVIRHELEHSLQREAHGQRLLELHGVAEAVISERVGSLAGGGYLYQVIPDEFDANAAASVFVRSGFGNERIDELLGEGDLDSAAFRSLVGPAPLDSLPERMVRFLATVPDLCQRWADRQRFAFATLLDLRWRGAGALWQRLVEEGGLSGLIHK